MTIKDLSLAFLSIVLIASTLPFLKMAHALMPIDFFNAIRFSLFIPALLLLKNYKKSYIIHLFIFSFFNCFLNFAFTGLAIHTNIDASFLGLISIPRVIAITVISYLFLSQKINKAQLLGLIITCFVLYYFKVGIAAPKDALGLAYIICSAISWAIAFAYIKKKSIKFQIKDLFVINGLAAPFLWGFAFLQTTDAHLMPHIENILTMKFLFLVLYTSFAPIVFGSLIWQRLSLKYDSIKLNPIQNLTPFIVFFESVLFLNEPFNIEFLLLLLISFSGLYLCQKK